MAYKHISTRKSVAERLNNKWISQHMNPKLLVKLSTGTPHRSKPAKTDYFEEREREIRHYPTAPYPYVQNCVSEITSTKLLHVHVLSLSHT